MNSETLKNCELGFYDKFEFFVRILKLLTNDLLLLQLCCLADQGSPSATQPVVSVESSSLFLHSIKT